MTGRGTSASPHVPVLLEEVIGALAIQPGETAVDGTFGAGGYTSAMLQVGAGRVIAFDRDPEAIEVGRSLVPDPDLMLIEERFSQMDRVLSERGIGLVDAITLDIGVSSMQLDRADRGFSFSADGPLDMRMEKSGRPPPTSSTRPTRPRSRVSFATMARSRALERSLVRSSPTARSSGPASLPPSSAAHRLPAGPEERSCDPDLQAIRIHLNAELDELRVG
jgi:16S rRNA (cytosine1402-N4)-methyltransferase